MNLPKIGRATFIAVLNSFGTIMLKHWTFQCQSTSNRCCKNTSIVSPQNCNIVLIPCPQHNLVQRHKNLTLSTFHPCCHQMKSRKCSESSAASYTMPVPSTSQYWWPSAPLQSSKPKPQQPLWKKPDNSLIICQWTLTTQWGSKRKTWSWTSTQMCSTYPRWTHGAEHAGIFSWNGTQKTVTLSYWMVHLLPYASSSVLSLHPQLKPNSELSSIHAKRVWFSKWP